MKYIIGSFITVSLFLSGTAFTSTGKLIWEDVFSRLGITTPRGEKLILSTMGSGETNFSSELVKRSRSLSDEVKVTVIRSLIQHARDYTSSSRFKKDYQSWRDEKLGYKQKGLGAIRNPLGALERKVDTEVDRQLNKADDERRFPSDPTQMLRVRLRAFMEISATVDFKASTRESGGTIYFNKSDYEARPNEWKACFRAGESVVKAAREEVEVWLKELDQ